jgi:GDP-4-dehydro-6-deoxy-D-mannose reductase
VSRRALVTGAAGFVGQWLCRALLQDGWTVFGAGVDGAPAPGTLTRDELGAVRWRRADVRRQPDVASAIRDAGPDVIFHLAGVSSLPDAQADPVLAHEINILGAARILAEVRTLRTTGAADPVVLVIGSAQQYGRPATGTPLRETDPQAPLSVYAASKAAQEIVALEAARSDGVRVVATRSFNHSGPGQAAQFLLPSLVSRALAIRDGGDARLRIGDPDTVRDYLHVRDVVRAYIALAQNGAAGEAYNVCSGIGHRTGDLAERVMRAIGVEGALWVDAGLVRGSEVPRLVGDPGKLQAATGWSPTLTCDDIIDDLIHAAAH